MQMACHTYVQNEDLTVTTKTGEIFNGIFYASNMKDFAHINHT